MYHLTRKRTGFTLVELLVVIGIIAVLVAMLLPALNKARLSALDVRCLSNLRQISTATGIYINDSKGAFPVHLEWTGGTRPYFANWDRLLAPYLGIRDLSMTANHLNPPTQRAEVLICPRDNSAEPPAGFHKRSYTANGVRDAGTARPQDGVVLRRNPWSAGVASPRITSVKRSAETIYLFEGTPPSADGANYALHNVQWFFSFGASIGFIGNPVFTPGSLSPLYANGAVAHHGKRMSVVYVDGHAALEDPKQFHTLSPSFVHGPSAWSRDRQ